MQPSIARISVQTSFCHACAEHLKPVLEQVLSGNHVALYPADKLIVFAFAKAFQVSEILNTLTALGYPPEGDYIPVTQRHLNTTCNC